MGLFYIISGFVLTIGYAQRPLRSPSKAAGDAVGGCESGCEAACCGMRTLTSLGRGTARRFLEGGSGARLVHGHKTFILHSLTAWSEALSPHIHMQNARPRRPSRFARMHVGRAPRRVLSGQDWSLALGDGFATAFITRPYAPAPSVVSSLRSS